MDKLRAKLDRTFLVAAVAALVAAGCDRPAVAGGRSAGADSPVAAMKIDSILPPGEALRRFQSELQPVTELRGGGRGRDALVTKFITAIERADTAAFESLALSKAEYGFLYYPSSVYTRKPYELAPDIAWLLNEQNGQKGAIRLIRRLGGRAMHFGGYTCGAPVTEEENRFWRDCQVTYVDPTTSSQVTRKLFGTIMERGGQYKFLSYANDF